MSRHFLCCIPVRFGVLVQSFFMFWGSLAVAAASAFLLHFALKEKITIAGTTYTLDDDVHISTGLKIGLGVVAGVYAIFAIISLFGFIGAAIANRRMVKAYSALMWFLFVINLLVGVAAIVLSILLKKNFKDLDVENICRSAPANSHDDCVQGIKNLSTTRNVVSVIVTVVIQLLIQLYGCIIVKRYVQQLSDHEAYKAYTTETSFNVGRGRAYQPVGHNEEHAELLGTGAPPQGAYPYADPHNSFGTKA